MKDPFTREGWFELLAERLFAGDSLVVLDFIPSAVDRDPDIPESVKRFIRAAIVQYQLGESLDLESLDPKVKSILTGNNRHTTLDAAFGLESCKVSDRRKRMRTEGVRSAVKQERAKLKESGNPLKEDPLEVVGDHFRLSRATIGRLNKKK